VIFHDLICVIFHLFIFCFLSAMNLPAGRQGDYDLIIIPLRVLAKS